MAQPVNPYEDGKAAARIVEVLRSVAVQEGWFDETDFAKLQDRRAGTG